MNAAKYCQKIDEHAIILVHREGPVFYASLPCRPCAAETFKGSSNDLTGDKYRLVSILWDQIAAMESPLWKCFQSSNRNLSPIQVMHDQLGKPHLWRGECRGPAISFSECGERVWAAICSDEFDIGIDVAGPDEFRGNYPFQRVFHTQELQHVLSLAGGDLGKASALLWSVKEAAVKALGSAFHLVDPLQIRVYPSTLSEGGYTFHLGLSGKALARFPLFSEALLVRSLSLNKTWLSIAHLKWRWTCHA